MKLLFSNHWLRLFALIALGVGLGAVSRLALGPSAKESADVPRRFSVPLEMERNANPLLQK